MILTCFSELFIHKTNNKRGTTNFSPSPHSPPLLTVCQVDHVNSSGSHSYRRLVGAPCQPDDHDCTLNNYARLGYTTQLCQKEREKHGALHGTHSPPERPANPPERPSKVSLYYVDLSKNNLTQTPIEFNCESTPKESSKAPLMRSAGPPKPSQLKAGPYPSTVSRAFGN